ncbi:MAG: leucine-rich repeat protein [Oscillospiraceae bacterium]|nr:leucine-rich repeat protein [Oscillospiraceae bacterium]
MKRILALFLCLALCLSQVPAAFAGDIEIIDIPEGVGDLNDPLDEISIINPDGAEDPDAAAPTSEAEINAAPAIIDTGSCGEGLTWTLYEGGLLQIYGYGVMTDYERKGAPWYDYRAQITGLLIDCQVQYIGAYAFADCTRMAWSDQQGGYTLSCRGIGDCAFLACYKIDYMDLGPSLTSIGRQAFDYCEGLKRVTIRSAPSLGHRAFANCTALEEICFLGGVPGFSENTFGGSAHALAWYPEDYGAWTSSVRQNYGGTLTWKCGYHGWCGDDICWDIDLDTGELSLSGSGETWDFDQTVYRSDGVEESLGTEPSFRNYFRRPDGTYIFDSILSVTVGEGVTRLGKRTFEHLENAESFSLPETLVSIDQLAFAYCSALVDVIIPAHVDSINYGLFVECSNLKEIRFLGHAPNIHAKAFEDVTAKVYYYPLSFWAAVAGEPYGGNLVWVCDDQIGDDVAWFLYASGTLEIYGSGKTWNFDDDVPGFYELRDECVRLDVESGVTGLGMYLFSRMDQLEYAAFPETLREIGQSAFGNSGLQEIVFTGDAPSFGKNCFFNVSATASYPADKAGWTADVMQNYGGTITWAPKVVKPTITTQPKSVSTTAGTTVKFSVKATGGDLKYQWYYRTSSTGTWTKSTGTGAATKTLTVEAKAYRSGYQYRCRVSNIMGYKYSSAATLTVTALAKPTITTQPKSQTAAVGATAKFTVAATGGSLKYQWYYRTSSSGSWQKSTGTGATTKTLSVEAKAYRDGYQYRCKVSNAAGYKYSSAATLTVLTKPAITTQPKSQTATAGTTVTFTVMATGATSYQWYYRTSSTGEWKKCTGADATTASISVEAKSYRDGYQYRCKVSNTAGYVYTSTVTLTVK